MASNSRAGSSSGRGGANRRSSSASTRRRTSSMYSCRAGGAVDIASVAPFSSLMASPQASSRPWLVEWCDLDTAGCADEDLDALLGAREQLLATPGQLDAFLVHLQRLLERQVAGLEPGHDLA